MMQCNLKFYEHLTPGRIDALLDALRSSAPDSRDVLPVIYERPTDEEYRSMFPRAMERITTGGAEAAAK